jgi:hypothetical protein
MVRCYDDLALSHKVSASQLVDLIKEGEGWRRNQTLKRLRWPTKSSSQPYYSAALHQA